MKAIMRDYVSSAERLSPPRFVNFIGEVWLRYQLKCAQWEMESQAKKAAEWRFVVLQCQDKLRQLGVDPQEQVEDITKMLEVWLFAALIVVSLFCGLMFMLYREALADLIRNSMGG